MGTGRNLFFVCHVHLQVAGLSWGNNNELFVKRLDNYLIIIKRAYKWKLLLFGSWLSEVIDFFFEVGKSLSLVVINFGRLEDFAAALKTFCRPN